MDLMTEEGKAEAERLSRQLPTGDRPELGSLNDLGDDEDDDEDNGEGGERPFEEVYDDAVRAVLANRSRFDTLAAHAKSAKEDLKASIERLQNLRKVGARPDVPRQLTLRQTR